MQRAAAIALPWLALWALGACASYRAGPPESEPVGRVWIESVRNESFLASATPALNDSLREAFARDPRARLASDAESADSRLDVVLIAFDRREAATLSTDTGRAASLRLTLTAEVTWTTPSGRLLDAEPVSASTTVYDSVGFPAAQEQHVPLLTRDLATRIRDRALSGWHTADASRP